MFSGSGRAASSSSVGSGLSGLSPDPVLAPSADPPLPLALRNRKSIVMASGSPWDLRNLRCVGQSVILSFSTSYAF